MEKKADMIEKGADSSARRPHGRRYGNGREEERENEREEGRRRRIGFCALKSNPGGATLSWVGKTQLYHGKTTMSEVI